jgi:hypothetical protein
VMVNSTELYQASLAFFSWYVSYHTFSSYDLIKFFSNWEI